MASAGEVQRVAGVLNSRAHALRTSTADNWSNRVFNLSAVLTEAQRISAQGRGNVPQDVWDNFIEIFRSATYTYNHYDEYSPSARNQGQSSSGGGASGGGASAPSAAEYQRLIDMLEARIYAVTSTLATASNADYQERRRRLDLGLTEVMNTVPPGQAAGVPMELQSRLNALMERAEVVYNMSRAVAANANRTGSSGGEPDQSGRETAIATTGVDPNTGREVSAPRRTVARVSAAIERAADQVTDTVAKVLEPGDPEDFTAWQETSILRAPLVNAITWLNPPGSPFYRRPIFIGMFVVGGTLAAYQAYEMYKQEG